MVSGKGYLQSDQTVIVATERQIAAKWYSTLQGTHRCSICATWN